MNSCSTCGSDIRPVRPDGECFGCHLRSVGFTYRGGAVPGRHGWNTTRKEYIDRHVGEHRIRSGDVERVR